MNCFYVGTHRTGKSTKSVKVILNTLPQKIWLIAANPNQKDARTGMPIFPTQFQRTDASILTNSRLKERQNSAILIDDAVTIRKEWQKIESIYATPRQNATDIHLVAHDYSLINTKLAGYCNMAFCFRTANNVPPYSSWGMKREMKKAADIIRQRGNIHSYYVLNILEGTIKVVL